MTGNEQGPAEWSATDDRVRRARRTLLAAVVGSVLIMATTFFVGLHLDRDDAGGTPPVALGPQAWPPPFTTPTTSPSGPASSAPATTTAAPPAPEDEGPAEEEEKATPKPVPPSLTITPSEVPATVDLAAEGSRDWVHWGAADAASVDRKKDGTAEIRDLDSASPVGRYDNNPARFRWAGGTPTASSDGTPTGIYRCGKGASFTLSVPASPTVRTLRLYAGLWMARGRLVATVAGKTATADLENTQAISTRRFVIRYRAAAGRSLRLTWTATEVFHPTCGNVDLQAATLG